MKLIKHDLKTWNSQQSDIDMFSKLQNSFLQKFFRLNLIDYFDDIVTNMFESHTNKKIITKSHKALLTYLFRVQKSFMINQFEQKIHSFYKHRAKSFQSGQLQHIFKIRYCNWNPVPNMVKKGQLILIDVKIKAEIQRLESLPIKLIQTLQFTCRSNTAHNNDDQLLKHTFKDYTQQYINIFIVYFGDINFHIVSKKNYQQQSITLYGKKYKLRIFSFFISKQALLQTFRAMNKISTLDHINQLAIQYYQVRRQKKKQKQSVNKDKENSQKIRQNNFQLTKLNNYLKELPEYVKLVVGGIGVVAMCIIGYKWLWIVDIKEVQK